MKPTLVYFPVLSKYGRHTVHRHVPARVHFQKGMLVRLTEANLGQAVSMVIFDPHDQRFLVQLKNVELRVRPEPMLAELKALGWIIDHDDVQAHFPTPSTR